MKGLAVLVLALVPLGGCVTVPAVVMAEEAKTPPGKVTVVEFVDFECPYCRATHDALAPLLASHAAEIRVVWKQVPLRNIHPHALFAAQAAVCAEAQGKAAEMADALFTMPSEYLTAEGTQATVIKLGLDGSAFASCLRDPKTRQRIDGDTADFDAADGHGVPLVYVGHSKIDGAAPRDAYEQALKRALAR